MARPLEHVGVACNAATWTETARMSPPCPRLHGYVHNRYECYELRARHYSDEAAKTCVLHFRWDILRAGLRETSIDLEVVPQEAQGRFG